MSGTATSARMLHHRSPSPAACAIATVSESTSVRRGRRVQARVGDRHGHERRQSRQRSVSQFSHGSDGAGGARARSRTSCRWSAKIACWLHFGLSGLKASRLNGIRALIKSAGLDGQNIDCYHVGFVLAPRLNACGRMGHANLAVQMLTDADPAKADEIATYLEQQNRARQTLERQILDRSRGADRAAWTRRRRLSRDRAWPAKAGTPA